ncbi:hypothetical protein ABZZ74_43390 [Streptomyces sp. NPDC006476]|uniref:hypothetical protein n=1 Tax=Streptomyces sp. NPDC006476 TaxID=3157175 RepID=UPI0033BD48F0
MSAIEDTAAATQQVPADGTTVRVLASMEARDATGRRLLAYELTLTARSGRPESSTCAIAVPARSIGPAMSRGRRSPVRR